MVDRNSVFYSSGRAAIFEGPSPRWDEDTYVLRREWSRVEEAKKLFTKFFTGKVSRLPINPRKPQNFSTLNDLHYMVHAVKCTDKIIIKVKYVF